MDDLRQGTRTILEEELAKLEVDNRAGLVEELEGLIFAKGPKNYAMATRNVMHVLWRQAGLFPDDVVGLMLAAGRLTPAAVVEMSATPAADDDPREIIRRMFVATLVRAQRAESLDREKTAATARAIELSCYNATVRASKLSENPSRRNWDSPVFVDIYSGRCGTVNSALDPRSSVGRAYSPRVAERLLTGELDPATLGEASARDLCPAATAAERAEIERRSVQCVKEKISNLFQCPHCKERRCTYREVQLRSLDEAPDYFCLCKNEKCGRRFKGRN